jgi:hypothetical protein
MIAAWFGVLKNPEPTPRSAIMSVGRIQWESTRRKNPIAKAPMVASTPIEAGMRGPMRSVRRPLTAASPIVKTGAARKISPMNDAEKPSTSWM